MKQPTKGATVIPIKKTTRTWRDLPVLDDGSNRTPTETFGDCAAFICANYNEFSERDFITLLAYKGESMPVSTIQKLFGRWVKQAVANGQVKEVGSAVYDTCMYRVC